jgi:copper homeostasis protein (lipoprotein)
MNKTLVGLLSATILLNTACSPKQGEAPKNSSSSASSAVAMTASSETTATAPTEAAVTPAESTSPPNGGLLNTNWKLILLGDKEVAVNDNQREASIFFSAENRVTGSDGCNSISGSYTLDGEKLTLGEMAGTKMACAEGGDQSQAFNEALAKVASYTVHADQLELRDTTGLVLARFKAIAQP